MAHNVFHVPGSIHKGYSTQREAREAFQIAQREGRVRAVDTGDPPRPDSRDSNDARASPQPPAVNPPSPDRVQNQNQRAHIRTGRGDATLHAPAPALTQSPTSRAHHVSQSFMSRNVDAINNRGGPGNLPEDEPFGRAVASSPHYIPSTPRHRRGSGATSSSLTSGTTLITQYLPMEFSPAPSRSTSPHSTNSAHSPLLRSPAQIKTEPNLLSPLNSLSRTRDLQPPTRAASFPAVTSRNNNASASVRSPAPLTQSVSAPVIGRRPPSSVLSYEDVDRDSLVRSTARIPPQQYPSSTQTNSSYSPNCLRAMSTSSTPKSVARSPMMIDRTACSFRQELSDIPTGITQEPDLPRSPASSVRSPSRPSELFTIRRPKFRSLRDAAVQTGEGGPPASASSPRIRPSSGRPAGHGPCPNCRKTYKSTPSTRPASIVQGGDTAPASPMQISPQLTNLRNALGLSESMPLMHASIDPVFDPRSPFKRGSSLPAK